MSVCTVVQCVYEEGDRMFQGALYVAGMVSLGLVLLFVGYMIEKGME